MLSRIESGHPLAPNFWRLLAWLCISAVFCIGDPGRIGAYFHYIHAALVAGVIITVVSNDLVIAHLDESVTLPMDLILMGGPAIYALGNGIYKSVVYGRFPLSRAAGLVALAVLFSMAFLTAPLMIGGAATVILLAIGIWEWQSLGSGSGAFTIELG